MPVIYTCERCGKEIPEYTELEVVFQIRIPKRSRRVKLKHFALCKPCWHKLTAFMEEEKNATRNINNRENTEISE